MAYAPRVLAQTKASTTSTAPTPIAVRGDRRAGLQRAPGCATATLLTR
jgi:hypothetical protein